MHAEGRKTEKARQPTVESLVRGICRLRVSKSREESTGGCLELRTVTEIRRSRWKIEGMVKEKMEETVQIP